MSEPSPLLCPLPDPRQALTDLLSAGLRQLRQEDPADAELLEPWAEPLLTRMAWHLVQNDQPPDHKLKRSENFVEAELAAQSRPGTAQDLAGRRKLMFLLESGDRLMREAGWLSPSPRRGSSTLVFSSWLLPNLLVGKRLGQDRGLAEAWRDRIGTRPEWALAAWAAVKHGDPVASWTKSLLAETDPVRLFGRLVSTACALAAADPAELESDAPLRAAYALCASGLARFPPRYEHLPGNEKLFADAWQLPRVPWQQAVLALASLPLAVRHQLAVLDPDPDLCPHEKLSPLLRTLELARPGATPPRYIAALLRPEQGLAQGWMDAAFWTQLSIWSKAGVGNLLASVQGHSVTLSPYEQWMGQVLVPLLVEQADAGSVEARQRLALPQQGAAFFLMNRPDRYLTWERAWLALAEEGETGTSGQELCAAWAEAASRQLGNEDSPERQEAQRSVLERPVARLRERGDWPQGLKALRQKILEQPPSGRTPHADYKIRLLRLCELTPEDWALLLQRVHPDLEGDLLYRDAGAPRSLLAQRAVLLLGNFAGGDREHQARLGASIREALADLETLVTTLSAAEPRSAFGEEVSRWPPGPWLEGLLAPGSAQAPLWRRVWLRHLAQQAADPEVRSRVVRALMAGAEGTP